jgi:hypothetical protein
MVSSTSFTISGSSADVGSSNSMILRFMQRAAQGLPAAADRPTTGLAASRLYLQKASVRPMRSSAAAAWKYPFPASNYAAVP